MEEHEKQSCIPIAEQNPYFAEWLKLLQDELERSGLIYETRLLEGVAAIFLLGEGIDEAAESYADLQRRYHALSN